MAHNRKVSTRMNGQGITVQLQFRITAHTQFGQVIHVLGNTKELGLWQIAGGVSLTTTKQTYPEWLSGVLYLTNPIPITIEYKYVIVKDGLVVQWESFDGNRIIVVNAPYNGVIQTADSWGAKAIPVAIAAPKPEPQVRPVSVEPTQDTFIAQLAQLDASHLSWKRKLEVVSGLLQQENLTNAALGAIAAYCHFMKAGYIVCQEEEGHHRPNNHAELSRTISGVAKRLINSNNSLILRQIVATLPSYKSAFTACVPLTRIRDIAHRNDIPQDLKREIKTTLQNKLHRCAGPEDLVTCEAILSKITNQGLSEDFVNEFKQFHTELMEFFNATGLDDRLTEFARVEPSLETTIATFLDNKAARSKERESSLTRLRQELSAVEPRQESEAQDMLLADIELASYAFTCFSEKINAFGDEMIKEAFGEAVKLTDLLLQNLIISDYQPEECTVLIHEFTMHNNSFPVARDQLLRLKATCERTLRMTSEYSDQVSEIQPKVNELGRVLSIEKRAVSIFSEGLIRSQLPFQLSKLVSLLLKLVRKTGQFSPWLPIRTGSCQGIVVFARFIAEVSPKEPTILILQNAEGDEEIPPNVVGLVISHDLPQLSHLAVRLRQAKVVSAACESMEEVAKLPRGTHYGELIVSGGEVRLLETLKREYQGQEAPSQVVVSGADVALSKVIPADKAEQNSCGAKAYMSGRLEALSQTIPGYRTPKGACIPFGIYLRFFPRLPQVSREAALEYMSTQLQVMQTDLEVISSTISNHFVDTVRPLIFRSSANVEDTANISGAGLYDSIPNIPVKDLRKMTEAIAQVWKSIATERAWNSREYNRLLHASALMGILVQELISPQFSFVVHTTSPFTSSEDVYIELAPGLGETLASGEQRGSPYRLAYAKATATLTVLALASYSFALFPTESGLARVRNDYSQEDLSLIQTFGQQIGAVSVRLETALHSPQDIEGVISEGEVWIVQTRPQV